MRVRAILAVFAACLVLAGCQSSFSSANVAAGAGSSAAAFSSSAAVSSVAGGSTSAAAGSGSSAAASSNAAFSSNAAGTSAGPSAAASSAVASSAVASSAAASSAAASSAAASSAAASSAKASSLGSSSNSGTPTTQPQTTAATNAATFATTGKQPTANPSPTAKPPGVASLSSLAPVSRVKYFLAGASGSVQFKATLKGDSKGIKSVAFAVGGRSIGQGTKCGNDYCISYAPGSLSSGATMTATPTLYNDRAGPAVSYTIALFKAPAWLLGLLAAPSASTLGTVDKWSRDIHPELVRTRSEYNFQAIPYIGFAIRENFVAEYHAKIEDHGAAEFEGAGGLELVLDPNCCSEGGGKVLVNVGAALSFVNGGSNVYTTRLSDMTMGIYGEINIPTPWAIKTPEKKFGPFHISGYLGVAVRLTSSIKLKFSFEESGRLFGKTVPFAFQSLTGTIQIGPVVSGKIEIGPASASLTAHAVIGPVIGYEARGGVAFKGMRVSVDIIVSADIPLYGAVSYHIITFDWPNKKREELDNLDIRDANMIDRRDTKPDLKPLVNIWSPTVKSTRPFIIENVYPSAFFPIASVSNVTLTAWTSFNPAITGAASQQVQFAYRSGTDKWSSLDFVGGSTTLPVVSPVLAVKDKNTIVAIGSQVTNPSAGVDNMNVRLVWSSFNTRALTFGNWAPIWASNPSGSSADYAPMLSQDATVLVFIRSNANSKSLMSSFYQGGVWSAPIQVNSQMTSFASYSVNTDDQGNALLVYADGDLGFLTSCVHLAGASSWTCAQQSNQFMGGLGAVRVKYCMVGKMFRVLYSANMTVYIATAKAASPQLTKPTSFDLPAAPVNLAVTSTSIVHGGLIVGFNTLDARGTGFSYALLDTDGQIWYAPSLWLNNTVMGNGAPMSIALATESDGHVLLATSFRDDTDATRPTGTLTVKGLAIGADAAIEEVTFNPSSFSNGKVSIAVRVSNLGLTPYTATNEKVTFEFVPSNGGASQVIATVPMKVVMPGVPTSIEVPTWNLPAVGGTVLVTISGTDGNVTNNAYVADPCQVTLSEVALVMKDGNPFVAARLQAAGVCGNTYKAESWGRPTVDDGEMPDASLAGSTTVTLSPNMDAQILIPATDRAAVAQVIIARLYLTNSFISAQGATANDTYEFSFDADAMEVIDDTVGAVVVELLLKNAGMESASDVPITAYELFPDGTQQRLLSTSAAVTSHGNAVVRVTLPLTAQMNNVNFRVNEKLTYPEVYVANNNFTRLVYVPDGTPDGGWNTGTVKSHHSTLTTGGMIGLIVGVILIVLIVAAVSFYLIYRINQNNANSAGGYTRLEQ